MPEHPDTSRGYLDLLGGDDAPRPTVAQSAMNNRIVAAIYERLWRPAGVAAMGFYGLSPAAERQKAADDLHLSGSQRVLDVACGPGNFTSFFGSRLNGDGIAVGFDISKPMLDMAARENRNAHAAYIRGDARHLPFDDGTFHGVCCYAALYLVPEPFTVVREMLRVLAPGGRVTIMTSYTRENLLVREAITMGAKSIGVRMFDRSTFPTMFADAGLTDIHQQIHGIAQFVSARKP
ncbi:methyltransferase domain-containing protein [Skermania sp. ID1734]|nr:methyltransferase domain-containing protein [Skermania sp. ID1734]